MSNFYQRGHQKQQDSYGGGGGASSWNLPPLSLPGTLALHLGFAIKGAQDAMNLRVAGEKIQLDRVSLPSPSSEAGSLVQKLSSQRATSFCCRTPRLTIETNRAGRASQHPQVEHAARDPPCLGARHQAAPPPRSGAQSRRRPLVLHLLPRFPCECDLTPLVVRLALTPSRAQLFWLYPLAAAATYYSGLLRASEETDKRSSRSSSSSDNRGLAVKIVSEVCSET